MGYLHINNLYKSQEILLFRECYAMEKIHGTSSHIGWNFTTKKVSFFAGGESHEKFIKLFDEDFLKSKFEEIFPDIDVVIFGEAYGGKQQGMSHTYGKDLKFIGFDVKVGELWLNVPNACDVCMQFNIDFVFYEKINVTLDNLTAARDMDSVQAVRNGMGTGHKREGVVLRPLVEMRLNNGDRVICKYKPDEQMETKSKREVSTEQLQVLSDAKAVAEEWVTNLRLEHILQKFPADVNIESMGKVIKAMVEDVYREGKGEILESKEVGKAIGSKAVQLFKQKLKSRLQ
jgi:RNA ligase